LLFALLLILLFALLLFGVLRRAWPTGTLITRLTRTDSSVSAETPVSTEYIHVCPNQDPAINTALCDNGVIKGFVKDNGHRFIPNGLNTTHVWCNRPNGRVKGLDTNYDDWMQKLSSKGVNSVHLRLDTITGKAGVVHMQLSPLGYYYIADEYPMEAVWSDGWTYSNYNEGSHAGTLIDGNDFLTNYANCRYPHFTDKDCGPTYASKFSNSNITKILQAAEAHDVKVIFTFWGSEQYSDDARWEYSAYNQACKKPDRSDCNSDEAGILTDKHDIIFDPHGNIPGITKDGKNVLDYQKQYIDFFYKAWGESEAIWMWEIMNEIHYLAKWNPGPGELDDNVDKKLLPWVEYMSNYIRSIDTHHRPVSISGIHRSWEDGAIADPRLIVSSENNLCDQTAWQGAAVDFFLACKHKMFEYVDVVNLHDYGTHTLKGRLDEQKRLDEIWPDKPKIIGEFLPKQCRQSNCDQDPQNECGPTILEGQNTYIGGYPWHIEIAPFHNSVSYYWLSLISNGGNGEVRRWTGFGIESWREGAAFHFNNEYDNEYFSDIAVPTGKFIPEVHWSDWGNHTDWDQYITISNTGLDPANDFVLTSRGDGNQVMVMFRSLSDDSTPIEIRNLEEGTYTVKLFDWLTGERVETRTVETVGNTLSINVDVRWTARDRNDFYWNAWTKQFEGSLVDGYDTDYTNPIAPNLGSDWPRLILSDATPGREREAINRFRRNIGIVLIERLHLSNTSVN